MSNVNNVITISREFGSGGREIGRRLAEKLKIAYYDQEIVAEMIKKTTFSEEYIRHLDENRPLPLFPITTARTFGMSSREAMEKNLSFYMQESRILQEMAKKSDCVIVGRCGDFVLREMKPLRLFIYADMEFKMERCRQRGDDVQGLSDEGLKKEILTVDKKRAKYYQFFTDQVWGKKEYYDLCINTTGRNISELAGDLASFPMIRHRGHIR